MTIYNSYLEKYVSSVTASKVSHTPDKANALTVTAREGREICAYLNCSIGKDHYLITA